MEQGAMEEQQKVDEKGGGEPETGGMRLGRVFGIPIYVHFSWFIVFALIAWTLATGYFPQREPDLPLQSYWARGLVASLLFFASILLHELGHSLVARRSGVAIQSITLFIFGGVARMTTDPPHGRVELKIAAAGPAVSVALAALFYSASRLEELGVATQAVTRYLGMINLGVAVFNLVPAFPLDGGRLLRGLLWGALGKVRATRVAAGAGTLFAYALMLAGALALLRGSGISGVWYILIGLFLKEAAAGTYRQVRLDEVLRGVTVEDAMLSDVATLPGEISLAEAGEQYFLKTGYAAYPVRRGEQVVGVLSIRDILRRTPEDRLGTSVQGAMTPLSEDLVIGRREPLLTALAQMARAGAGRLFVMDEGRRWG